MEQQKKCSACQLIKIISEFHKNKHSYDGYHYECKTCKKARDNAYYQKNKENIAKKSVVYRLKNKTTKTETDRIYYENNKSKISEYKKNYYQQNKETYRLSNQLYYVANKEDVRKKQKEYNLLKKAQKNNTDKMYRIANVEKIANYKKFYYKTEAGRLSKAISHNKRRAMKKNCAGKYTKRQIVELFNRQSGRCAYCGVKFNKTGTNRIHIDHIVALSNDGSNEITNIQLLCPKCNLKKGAKDHIAFANELGLLL